MAERSTSSGTHEINHGDRRSNLRVRRMDVSFSDKNNKNLETSVLTGNTNCRDL